MVGYLGPNGSGKTTTGRMVTGLVAPIRRTRCIRWPKHRDDLVAFRRRLGYVPEEPHLSASVGTRVPGARRAAARTARRSRDKITGSSNCSALNDAADQRIAAYSKG